MIMVVGDDGVNDGGDGGDDHDGVIDGSGNVDDDHGVDDGVYDVDDGVDRDDDGVDDDGGVDGDDGGVGDDDSGDDGIDGEDGIDDGGDGDDDSGDDGIDEGGDGNYGVDEDIDDDDGVVGDDGGDGDDDSVDDDDDGGGEDGIDDGGDGDDEDIDDDDGVDGIDDGGDGDDEDIDDDDGVDDDIDDDDGVVGDDDGDNDDIDDDGIDGDDGVDDDGEDGINDGGDGDNDSGDDGVDDDDGGGEDGINDGGDGDDGVDEDIDDNDGVVGGDGDDDGGDGDDGGFFHSYVAQEDPGRSGLIPISGFKSIYKKLVYRPELLQLFHRLSEDRRALSVQSLREFLQDEQCQAEEDAERLLHRHELMAEAFSARRDNYLTIEGFTRLMTSEDVHILRKEHCQVYQDMTQPLTNYYISSSHNTYLLSNQIVGQSHLYAYSSVLLRGCRCLEIDCWDGEADEPLVFHGHTLTSRLLFRDVVSVIKQYAFQASPYPLILSLENHCSPRQQEVMAKHLRTILGETLLSMTLDNSFSGVLPSPEALKGKILIKDKKVGLLKETILGPLPSTNGQVAEYEEQGEDDEKEDSKKRRFFAKLLQRSPVSKTEQLQKTMLSRQLSDLVIYTKSKKFISFQYSRENQKFYEINSLSEQEAQKLVQSSAPEFVHHTCRFLTRIYPKGSRISSSNFCPSAFWNVGCQMVALNFQTPGIAMDLQDGKFLDNGGCGYVLKPEYLRSEESGFHGDSRPLVFTIKVISGFFLPHGSLSTTNTTSLTVTAEIYGGADDGRQKTRAVKNNLFSPLWNQALTFSVQRPALALLRVSVEDQRSIPTILPSECIGQYTLPLTSVSRGYRIIPLLNKYGQSLAPAALFVHVSYQ
ncbi:1-phosphatidylinositol 4,5-bisphosphate phosphodiesterase zeta-1 [Dendrobates tinctorius]|uniref:1-phosphatidylinositol 4,5-bisphosphate phosphodiesterase zeta-1 n=1 Tax=Dendrobates tinctorius TaxID=92724 RepID=UPI003CC9754E